MGPLIKLLIFLALLYAVWNLVRQVLGGAAPPRPRPEQKPKQIEDMVKCRACGSYMTADAGACGRADCPRR